MAASNQTVEQILRVVLRHVSHDTAVAILDDMLDVPGNESVRETIRRLHKRAVDGWRYT